MKHRVKTAAVAVLCVLAAPLAANPFALKGALVTPWLQDGEGASFGLHTPAGMGSAFAGRSDGSLFAPVPVRLPPGHVVPGMGTPVSPGIDRAGVAGLRDLIARAEAGAAGYDAVVYSARIKPARAPSQMTLGDIYAWIDDTPGQNHAIGRYQFIPKTLRRVAGKLGIGPQTRFSPDVQDRMANLLLEDAGLSAYLSGQLSRTRFMNNLARIWAGLPTSSGKSHYAGVAGNKAVISWGYFSTQMGRIFPSLG